MLRCDDNLFAGNSTDTSVFENRLCQDQRYSDQSRQSYQLDSKTIESYTMSQFHNLINNNSIHQEMTSIYMKADRCFGSVFPEFGDCRMAGSEFIGDTTSLAVSELEIGSSFGMNNSFSMNLTSSKAREAAAAVVETGGRWDSTEETAANIMIGGSNLRKRKAELCAFYDEAEHCDGHKEIGGEARQEEFEDNSKDRAKFSNDQKPDYIHVRAPRGQATDSHSLAERARREKINKKMKYLQELVPGCSKVTGKAGMLDEIINYVQSLQRQVEFLSMKLASSNPRVDFNINSLFTKEYPAHLPSFPAAVAPSEMDNLAYLQFSQAQHGATSCVITMPTNHTHELPSQKTPSSSLPFPALFLDSFCFPQVQPHPTWETDIQMLQ